MMNNCVFETDSGDLKRNKLMRKSVHLVGHCHVYGLGYRGPITCNVGLWYKSSEYSGKGIDLTFWLLKIISYTGTSFGPFYIMT